MNPPIPGVPVTAASPAQATEPDDAQAPAARVRAELVTELYEATPLPALAGVPFAIIIATLFWDKAPLAVVVGWLAIKLVMAAWRSTETARFRADTQREQRRNYWIRRYQVLMVIDTVSWAVMVPLFAANAGTLELALLMCGVLGVASLGVFTTFTHIQTTLLFCLLTVTPMILHFLIKGTDDGLAVAASSAIYLAVLCFEGWRSHGRQVELLRLRFHNAAIAEERSKALAQAQALTRAKSRFLATVSHEMRTPLNGILGLSELMRDEEEGDDAAGPSRRHQRLDVVIRSARHLDRVIGDLLDLSAIEFGRLTIRHEPVRLRETLLEVADLLGAVARDKGLGLRVHLDPALPLWVLGDAMRIKQVLHNLLGNAIKFTPRGEVALEVSLLCAGWLSLSVQDSGPGVEETDRERIFDVFERGAQAGAAPGSGLGLAISRRLAEAMGGSVDCQDQAGLGSRFEFRLPFTPIEAPAVPGTDGAKLPRHALAGRRILVVDDNDVNALVARTMLERLGAQAEVAEDGQQALDALQGGSFDAVLMDCQMPRLDGFEATRRWRQTEASGRLPIVGLTAFAGEDDRRACLDAGMDGHLAKPYLLAELVAALDRHLTPSSAPASAAG